MVILLTILHVLICFFLIIVVLLQSGKAADLAGAFGGMGSQTAFGPRGSATVLSKATKVAAALFMLTSLTLSIYATKRGGVASTVLEKTGSQAQPVETGVPAGQPSVTLTPEGGPSTTIPLELPPPPGQQPAQSPKQ